MDRLNKWAIGSIAVAIVTALTLMLGRARPVEDHAVILSDGTSLRLLTVTMGTNHQAGLRFAHLFKILPKTVAESIEGWIGNKPSGMSLQTSETNLVVWFEQKGPPWGTRVSRSVMLKASGGRISGEEQHAGFHLTTGQTNRIHSIRFRNWPRREEWIECDIFERDAQHENQKIGSFKFRNPTITDRPSWTHDHSPTVQYAGDLKVTLRILQPGSTVLR
jgi:hypothetical protein